MFSGLDMTDYVKESVFNIFLVKIFLMNTKIIFFVDFRERNLKIIILGKSALWRGRGV